MNKQEQFASLVMSASRAHALKKIVFSRPVAGDNAEILRIVGTLRQIGGAPALQLESFHRDNKAKHENLSLDGEGEARLAARVAEFGQINLITTAGEAEFKQNKKGSSVLLRGDKLSRKLAAENAEKVEISGNDKDKNRILTGAEPFLRHLGVADENGRVFDKNRAKFGIERVPERVLMFFGIIGGAAGMLMMMHLVRHKTRRPKFKVGFPIMIVFHVLVFVWIRYSSFIMILY